MNKTDKRFPEANNNVCELYEGLRASVLETSGGIQKVYGLGVIIIRGMAAWVEAIAEQYPSEINGKCSSTSNIPASQVIGNQNFTDLLINVIIKQCQLEI